MRNNQKNCVLWGYVTSKPCLKTWHRGAFFGCQYTLRAEQWKRTALTWENYWCSNGLQWFKSSIVFRSTIYSPTLWRSDITHRQGVFAAQTSCCLYAWNSRGRRKFRSRREKVEKKLEKVKNFHGVRSGSWSVRKAQNVLANQKLCLCVEAQIFLDLFDRCTQIDRLLTSCKLQPEVTCI